MAAAHAGVYFPMTTDDGIPSRPDEPDDQGRATAAPTAASTAAPPPPPPPVPALPADETANQATAAGTASGTVIEAPGEQSPEAAGQPVHLDPLDQLAAAHRETFFQKKSVQTWLPMATSVAVHLAIILTGLAFLDRRELLRANVEEQIVIPDAAIVEGAEVGGIPNPGLGGDPTRAAAQDMIPEAGESQGWSERPSQTVQAALVGGGSESETQADTMIGVGASAGAGVQGPGQGPGGASGEGGGELAPFGIPGGGGGIGPSANFVGISGNARRVVYICDATGTMLGLKYTLLKRELHKALDILKPIQGFNIIFFKGGDTDADWANPFARQLVVANPANKQKARQFVETFQVVGKGTNPLPALRQAFSQDPQLIYFLTDGQFDNVVSYKEVLAEVRSLNANKKVKINTIAFMSEDEQAEKTLAEMAREHGGRFVKVTERDLD